VPDSIFQELNNKQAEAVKIIDGPVLVISGPGSGKTKCLTHRIAYLISQKIRPENILAVTFTNKASQEMRNRVIELLDKGNSSSPSGQSTAKPLIGTFHSICLRILRREIHNIGYERNFNIFDYDDQLRLTKRVMTDLEIDTKKFNPRAILANISKLKTELTPPEEYDPPDFFPKIVAKVYKSYQSELKKSNALDFDDLIVFTIKIFRENPQILHKYQNFWQYLLVDEYQDTSYDQYVLIKLLSQKNKNLFCIGDDAQSIYMFRKADIRNILNFQKDYPEAKIIKLEQNYRSTKNIITAAQEIISNNKNQIQKDLWTENDGGDAISVTETLNEKREATYVISEIEKMIDKKYDLKDMAVLYRTHAQSRAMEEALIHTGYPYQIVGGIKFYERKEIKDILAYLRLANNPKDKVSLERICNVPPRGIGKASLDKMLKGGNLTSKISKAFEDFNKLLKNIEKFAKSNKLSDIIKYIIKKTEYENYLKEFSLSKHDDHENFEERMENIKELLTVAKKYNKLIGKEGVERFLEEIALLQETDKIKKTENRITLMTTHSSKGLEFPVVFVIGLEEGLFPHSRAIINPSELEEERRLCYVAITRAKKHLFLTHTRYRNIFGRTEANLPSRFLTEIPATLTNWKMLDYNKSYDDNYDDYDDDEKIYY
jgi:DNA helicase II / ATP-dependent DNA helicase PcrA